MSLLPHLTQKKKKKEQIESKGFQQKNILSKHSVIVQVVNALQLWTNHSRESCFNPD
jgi:hypothetical protein